MTEAHHTETIGAPIGAVYQQWLDVESFPAFVPMVHEVTTSADVYSHWTLSIGRSVREFDCEVIEQLPEQRVRWRTITGDLSFACSATFAEAGENATLVTLSVTWNPKAPAERAAALLGADDRAVRSTVRAFKAHLEKNGGPSGHSHITLRPVDGTAEPDSTAEVGDDSAESARPSLRRPRHLRE